MVAVRDKTVLYKSDTAVLTMFVSDKVNIRDY